MNTELKLHPLYPHLMAAIEQAMYGKGQRHGGDSVPFLEQPLFHYLKMHGRGFATGQAAKKLEEAASTRTGEAFRQEVLGAIVYAAAALIYEAEQQEAQQQEAEKARLAVPRPGSLPASHNLSLEQYLGENGGAPNGR
jgi:hypothetical protein